MSPAHTLQRALFANAIFSLVSGTTFLVFAGPLTPLVGLHDSLILRAIGIGLLPFGGWVLSLSRNESLTPSLGRFVSLLDAQWVLGTLILLIGWPHLLNATGQAMAVGIALCVASFASWQIYGAKQFALQPQPQ
jgi:hypothetical protein